MALLERILVPVDFSERSFGAVRYVEALANKDETEVYLVHVTTPLNYELSALDVGGTVVSDLNRDRTAEVRDQLNEFLRDELHGFRVHRVLLDGDPAHRIVEFAHEKRMSLITMPTHGYGLFRRFLLGSVTAKVLHDADCAVWTGVHMKDAVDGKLRFNKIMVAVDLCPNHALKALSWASQMAERCGAELIITHAYPSLEGRAGEYFDPNWRSYFTQIATDEIMKMQQKLGLNSELILESGDIPQVVCNQAQLHDVDLLVIGRGSAAGVFGRLRANAYAIIRQSPCAVVSV